MVTLLAIRHAQASFDADNYDVLSPRGEQQAERLGAFLAGDPEFGFDRVVCGDMFRHRQTLAAIQSAFEAANRDLPEARFDIDFNEFDHGAVIEHFLAEFPEHPEFGGCMPPKSDRASIARFLAAALQSWAKCELEHRLAEGWRAFDTRIARARQRLLDESGSGERVLLVSSGGVIAKLAQAALEVSDTRTIDFNLSLMNSAISEFHWRDQHLRLRSWNTLPHLSQHAERQLWSHF
jgi:broad specificity phosphatase PhoE